MFSGLEVYGNQRKLHELAKGLAKILENKKMVLEHLLRMTWHDQVDSSVASSPKRSKNIAQDD